MSRQVFIQVSCLILLFILVYTGLTKWINFNEYSRSMYSQPLPHWLTKMLIYIIPTAEIIAALMLIPQQIRQWGLSITSIVMTAFTVYVFYIRFSAWENTTCPCGGLFSKLNWDQHIWVNSLITILAITTTLLNKKNIPGQGKRRNADASNQTK